ncbi:glycoside hydrolase family protein [Roseibium litorale]|uniref:Lysozyme n=1 Tax=Roseibium litorale TaxID=2803841 RepID=A0ABR9CSV2_9HYPH|nr:peptidoglycan-binding protein [Roseibium litorale]MBD8893485.1 peptidoglycan-binding protein [Roseibium litorale]
MKVSERGLAFIAAHEGFASRAYLDPAGVVTIGYGFTMRSRIFASWWLSRYGSALKVGDVLSRADANKLLLTMLDEEYAPLAAKALTHLTQTEFDACVSVVYNLGARALRWKWADALRKGDRAKAADLLARTGVTAVGRVLKGLERRRSDEAKLLASGDYGSPPVASTGDEVSANPAVREAQAVLTKLGYTPGPADGLAGQRTKAAVRAFQRDNPPLLVDGQIGPATLSLLSRLSAKRGTEHAGAGLGLAGAGGASLAGFHWQTALLAGFCLLLLVLVTGVIWRFRGRISAFATSVWRRSGAARWSGRASTASS